MDEDRKEQLDEQLSAYLDGELTDVERRQVDAWLERDPDARARMEGLRTTIAAVGQLPRAEASDDLLESLRNRMERQALLDPPSAPAHHEETPVSMIAMSRWLSMAAVLALCATTVFFLWPQDESESTRPDRLARLDEQPEDLRTPPAAVEEYYRSKPEGRDDADSDLHRGFAHSTEGEEYEGTLSRDARADHGKPDATPRSEVSDGLAGYPDRLKNARDENTVVPRSGATGTTADEVKDLESEVIEVQGGDGEPKLNVLAGTIGDKMPDDIFTPVAPGATEPAAGTGGHHLGDDCAIGAAPGPARQPAGGLTDNTDRLMTLELVYAVDRDSTSLTKFMNTTTFLYVSNDVDTRGVVTTNHAFGRYAGHGGGYRSGGSGITDEFRSEGEPPSTGAAQEQAPVPGTAHSGRLTYPDAQDEAGESQHPHEDLSSDTLEGGGLTEQTRNGRQGARMELTITLNDQQALDELLSSIHTAPARPVEFRIFPVEQTSKAKAGRDQDILDIMEPDQPAAQAAALGLLKSTDGGRYAPAANEPAEIASPPLHPDALMDRKLAEQRRRAEASLGDNIPADTATTAQASTSPATELPGTRRGIGNEDTVGSWSLNGITETEDLDQPLTCTILLHVRLRAPAASETQPAAESRPSDTADAPNG